LQDALCEARSLENEFEETRAELRRQIAEAEARYFSARSEFSDVKKQSLYQNNADKAAIIALTLSIGVGTITVVVVLLFAAFFTADYEHGPGSHVALIAPLTLLASAALLSFVRVRWAESIGQYANQSARSLLDDRGHCRGSQQPGPVAYAKSIGFMTASALYIVYRDLWLGVWCGLWMCSILSPPNTDGSLKNEKNGEKNDRSDVYLAEEDEVSTGRPSGVFAGALNIIIVASFGLGLRDCAFWTTAALVMLVPVPSKRAFRDEVYVLTCRSTKSIISN